jgi:hypothetical protein
MLIREKIMIYVPEYPSEDEEEDEDEDEHGGDEDEHGEDEDYPIHLDIIPEYSNMIYVPEFPSEDEEEDEDEDEHGEDEDAYPIIPEYSRESGNPAFSWAPCPTCPADNPHGYNCPDPIPSPGSDRRVRYYGPTFRNHVKCTFCENPLPTGWKPYKCDVCSDNHCGSMFECQVNLLHNYIAPVSDQTHALFEASTNWRDFNPMEKARLLRYMDDNDIRWDDICQKVFDRIILSGSLRSDQNICLNCAISEFGHGLMTWWISYQETNGIVDDRVKCWYGYGCRTQMHNENHAAR